MAPVVQDDPRERVISISYSVLSLVLGVVLLIGILAVWGHRHTLPVSGILVLVESGSLIGISAIIFVGLRRNVLRWRTPGPLAWAGFLLPLLLGAHLLAETQLLTQIMISWLGVPRKLANGLACLPVILGAAVFALYWRRASRQWLVVLRSGRR